MQRKLLYKKNDSSFFSKTGQFASTGAKAGALLGAGVGSCVAIFTVLKAMDEKKINSNDAAGLYVVAFGLIGGTTAGAVIGGVGGATIGFGVDVASAGINFSFKR